MPSIQQWREQEGRYWAVYFPSKPRVNHRKRALEEVMKNVKKADVKFVNASRARVHLVWPEPVKFDSAYRLVRLAKGARPYF